MNNHGLSYDELQYAENKQAPYKCPVCDGHGKHFMTVQEYVDRMNSIGEFNQLLKQCNTCDGKGVLWG